MPEILTAERDEQRACRLAPAARLLSSAEQKSTANESPHGRACPRTRMEPYHYETALAA